MSDDDGDDFMLDAGEDDYDFQYESDAEDDTGGDVDIENRYYNAKAMREEDPKAAIEEFVAITALEEEKGDWGFKALKQVVKLCFRANDKEMTITYYKQLLMYTKSAVTRNYSEKSINNILDYISSSRDMAFMEEFYATTLTSLEESRNERLWLKTNLKLAKLWLDRNEYGRLSRILRQLHAACQTNEGTDDQSKGTYLLEVYALEIQMYTETKNNKKLKELYNKTINVKSAIPHPRIMGCDSRMWGENAHGRTGMGGGAGGFLREFQKLR